MIIHSLIVLEEGSLKSGYWQGHTLSKSSRGNLFMSSTYLDDRGQDKTKYESR